MHFLSERFKRKQATAVITIPAVQSSYPYI